MPEGMSNDVRSRMGRYTSRMQGVRACPTLFPGPFPHQISELDLDQLCSACWRIACGELNEDVCDHSLQRVAQRQLYFQRRSFVSACPCARSYYCTASSGKSHALMRVPATPAGRRGPTPTIVPKRSLQQRKSCDDVCGCVASAMNSKHLSRSQ